MTRPAGFLLDENFATGVPAGGKFIAGTSDVDPITTAEDKVFIPTARDARASWVYYDVILECFLDSGIVVHRNLPQSNTAYDTLASCTITDTSIDKLTGRGVNLTSNDSYTDIVQRMAHSQYWFRLFGQALRVGEQVPIPGIKVIAGQPAIPHDENPQRAFNKIVGNYSGEVLWYARWSLWYTLASVPKVNQTPPQNLAQHITGDAARSKDGMQAPWTLPDDNAQSSDPRTTTLGTFIRG